MIVSKQDLEEYNLDYLRLIGSTEYRLGHRITRILRDLSKTTIGKTIRLNDKLRQDNEKILAESVQNNINRNHSADIPKAIVYSCVTGGYDHPRSSVCIIPEVYPILFTDKEIDCKTWNLIVIGEDTLRFDNNLVNRYFKMHPHQLFLHGESVLYIDGNVRLISDIRELCGIARQSRLGIAMHRHALRDCAYEEMKHCIKHGIGNKIMTTKQMRKYKSEGFPSHFGLTEATVIAFDLSNRMCGQILDAWWIEYLESASGRDQFSFPYTIWKNGFTMSDVGDLGPSVYLNPKLKVYSHKH